MFTFELRIWDLFVFWVLLCFDFVIVNYRKKAEVYSLYASACNIDYFSFAHWSLVMPYTAISRNSPVCDLNS